MFNKYIWTLLWYLWVWFIVSAIAQSFSSSMVNVIMAIVWIALFTIHQALQNNKAKKNIVVVLYGLFFSTTISMITSWILRFPYTPLRSLWIIPLWFFLSYILHWYHHKSTSSDRVKNINIAFGGSVVIMVVGYITYIVGLKHSYFSIDTLYADMPDTKIVSLHECAKSPQWCGARGKFFMDHETHTSFGTEEEFIRMMIPHHQEAVMTSMFITQKWSCSSDIIQLAKNITNTQITEIAMMEKWLSDWYPSDSKPADYVPMMRMTAQLQNDDQNIDMTKVCKEYIEDMITHHEWAVAMAQKVLTLDVRSEVATFANNIITLQTSEINIMKDILQQENKKQINTQNMPVSNNSSSSSWMSNSPIDHSMHMWH